MQSLALTLSAWAVLAWAIPAQAQVSPDEHAAHHPAGGPTGTTASAPGGPGGMMEGMGEMMKGMGAPPPKDVYPSLMALPELSAEQRTQVEAQAGERMHAGTVLMGQALDSLNAATQSGDYAGMHEAAVRLGEGLAQLESGIAARRALAEGRAPRAVALAWFKRELSLSPPTQLEGPRTLLGVTPFHLFTMVLLVAFAIAMLAMYFSKMRRAAALFGRLDSDSGSPPPGMSPPLAGAPGPSAPVAPPAGDAAPPAEALASATPPTPASGTPAASATPPGGSSAVPGQGGDAAIAADRPPAPPATRGLPATLATPPSVVDATSASPVTANWRGQLRVGSILTETPSVKTFRLLPPSNDRFLPFTFVPGQFLNVAFWIGGARMNRSYSISSSPTTREYVDLTVRREPRGAVSRHIVDLLKVGDKIEAGGPAGRFTFDGTETNSIVLIAGGVGITPMMSIIRFLTERSWAGDIFLVYACRAPPDFIFADELAAHQRGNPKLHVTVSMSRPGGTDWKGPRGHLTKDLVTQAVPDIASRRVHLCGPPSMMDSAKAILAELGVPPGQVKTELFGATRPTPAATGTTAKPTAPATGPLVTFSKNNKSANIHVDQTVLELSEELAIGIENSCRVGTCGICKVKMTSGEVEMAVEDALEPDDKAKGIILACQAKPKGDIAIEA